MIVRAQQAALTRVDRDAAATKSLFETLAAGPLPHWDEFASVVQLRQVEAGGTVFMQGAEHPFVYVVRRGLVKNLYLRDDGESWIKSFSTEGRFFASIAALKSGGRTSFTANCIEDSELERIPFDVIERYATSDVTWSNVLRKAIMIFAERKEQRERELLVLDPEQRYRALLGEQPELARRATQKDLAAYIGVTPVGLNRIVKRVRNVR